MAKVYIDKNQIVANELDAMRSELTSKAKRMIDNTDFGSLADMFGGLTAKELNRMAREMEVY